MPPARTAPDLSALRGARARDVSAGKVSGVVTEKGTIACDSVVLAGGAWSRRFCGNLGIYLPQLSVVNSVLRTAPLAGGPECLGLGGQVRVPQAPGRRLFDQPPSSVGRRYRAGFLRALLHLSAGAQARLAGIEAAAWPALHRGSEARAALGARPISPFEQVRVLDPEPVAAILDEALDSLRRTYPVFAAAEVAERWAGCIDVTPDAVPVISPVDSLPGLTLATGFSGHGFGIGPGAGRLVADLVTGAAPVVDPSPFRYSRFIDGSKLVPMA
jgi:glycine/D-amino acid oxidase-like deaminating enzyme